MSRDIVCQPGSSSQTGLCSVSIKVGATSAKRGRSPAPPNGRGKGRQEADPFANYDLQVASIASAFRAKFVSSIRAKCRNLRPIENKGLEFLRWLGRWLWCDNNHHQIALFVWHQVGHEHLPTQPPRIANAVRRSICHNQKKRVCCSAADAATSDNRRNSGLYLLKRAVPDTNRGSPRRSRTARRDRRGCGRGQRGNI
jgi:hypothetical protein